MPARKRPAAAPPPPLPPDWGDLQVFAAVAEAGTLGGAARRLGVDHSTVLRRVARLESDLGVRLFDRLPGGYAPTTAGNALAEQLAGVREQLDAAERRLAGLAPSIEGPIRFAASDVVVETLLMPLLASFLRRHPGVRIELVVDIAFAALARGEADLALRGADDAPAGLVARRIGTIETVPCAARRTLDAAGADRPLAAHRWVVVDTTRGFAAFERWFAEHVPAAQVVARIDSLVGVADAVAAGLGVGMLPRPLAERREGLVVLGPAEPALAKPLWLLMHPDVAATARMRALFDFLAAPHQAPRGAGAR